MALRRVAGDAVEEGAEKLRLLQALRVERLVDQHLHHHQLVDRQPGDALEQLLEALVELLRRRRLGRQPPLRRLLAAQRVAGQQQALGPHRPQPRRPQRRRRRAPDARRRVADLGVGADHEQVRAERHVGAAGDAVAVDLADHRLLGVEERHEAAHVAPHELEVGDRVPVRLRRVVGADHRRVERRAGRRAEPLPQVAHVALGRGDQVVAAAEPRAVTGEGDRMDLRVEVRPLDTGGDLDRHPRHDPVAALRPVQRDPSDPIRGLVGEGRQVHLPDPTGSSMRQIRRIMRRA